MRRRRIPQGVFTFYQIRNGIWTPYCVTPNTRVHTWGWIVAKALMSDHSGFWLNTMYIEYENVSNAEDPVINPTVDPAVGIEYYTGLSVSGDRDYLRVPMDRAPIITVAAGFEDSFAEGQGNVIQFHASTSGTEGVNGVPFGADYNSKVCGCAVVASPDRNDPSQDVIYARKYLDEDFQKVKEDNFQIGTGYRANFYDV